MCGIAGFVDKGAAIYDLKGVAQRMGDSIYHRGPDAGDVWVDESAGVGLSHRRLAIVDLSPAGAQPMTSRDGRYVMVYNGEVYNAPDIKRDLAEVPYKGHSDSEVILEAIVQWGVQKAVARLIGMFAIALWDRQERKIVLIRDRLGIKPLYWYYKDGLFLFGSELKALCSHPNFEKTVNRDAISSFLRFSYVPTPNSIYRDVQKLEAGKILEFDGKNDPLITSYWSLEDTILNGRSNRFLGSEDEAVDELEQLLSDAISRRMLADVPLGAFLSGGIDSSTVVALMQKQSAKPVRTFSIGFNEAQYNEAQHAADVAKHLGTDHTELYVTSQQAQDVIPLIANYYDEPFADSSQIPTYLVSKMTKDHVTVALSGDGGDELFGGYTRYFTAKNYARTLFNQPRLLRKIEAMGIRSLSPYMWDRLTKAFNSNVNGDRLYKLARVLEGGQDQYYSSLVSQWENPSQIVPNSREFDSIIGGKEPIDLCPDLVERMQYLDLKTYLVDDILTKVDRASMAVALEARVPILDHRVVEFSWRLSNDLKMKNGVAKWPLRQILYKYVPREMIERPKMGFGIPLDSWLRGSLREWAEDLLSKKKIEQYGLVRHDEISRVWTEHLSGRSNHQHRLWAVLMLQSWYEKWIN